MFSSQQSSWQSFSIQNFLPKNSTKSFLRWSFTRKTYRIKEKSWWISKLRQIKRFVIVFKAKKVIFLFKNCATNIQVSNIFSVRRHDFFSSSNFSSKYIIVCRQLSVFNLFLLILTKIYRPKFCIFKLFYLNIFLRYATRFFDKKKLSKLRAFFLLFHLVFFFNKYFRRSIKFHLKRDCVHHVLSIL